MQVRSGTVFADLIRHPGTQHRSWGEDESSDESGGAMRLATNQCLPAAAARWARRTRAPMTRQTCARNP